MEDYGIIGASARKVGKLITDVMLNFIIKPKNSSDKHLPYLPIHKFQNICFNNLKLHIIFLHQITFLIKGLLKDLMEMLM